MPLAPDPEPDWKAEFLEASISRQPTSLNQWALNILWAPVCKWPADTRVFALVLPAPKPERGKPSGPAEGSGKPSKPRAARYRCSARLCPTGTSTAPQSRCRAPPAAHWSARRRRPASLPVHPPSTTYSPARRV